MADRETTERAIRRAHAALIARNLRDLEQYGAELPEND